jgi:hypothetical protein
VIDLLRRVITWCCHGYSFQGCSGTRRFVACRVRYQANPSAPGRICNQLISVASRRLQWIANVLVIESVSVSVSVKRYTRSIIDNCSRKQLTAIARIILRCIVSLFCFLFEINLHNVLNPEGRGTYGGDSRKPVCLRLLTFSRGINKHGSAGDGLSSTFTRFRVESFVRIS